MSAKPIPRLLLTNDDGGRAEGLKVLEQIARELSDDVWVVAPEFDQSGTSHSINVHTPLRVYSSDERHHYVRGTPSDCVLFALGHLLKDQPPSLILSGVNRGANLSEAIAYSGTVGAAMTGMLFGVPSMALSLAFRQPECVRWETVLRIAPALVLELYQRGWPQDVCLNLNFPDLPADAIRGVSFTVPARGVISGVKIDSRIDTRDQPYHWIGFEYSAKHIDDPRTDIACLREGKISVTPLRFERDLSGEWDRLWEGLDHCLRN